MKNYELLDMIGEVNEDYVLAAGDNVVRPRFRWKSLAACAACAALVLCAYPVWRGDQSNAARLDSVLSAGGAAPQLHAYTVVEGGALATYDDQAEKIPAGGAESIPEADSAEGDHVGGACVEDDPRLDSGHNEDDLTMDTTYHEPSGDVPVQAAAEWYDALLRTYRLEEHPEWYGGAWLAGDELLAVAIVDGFRTPELEAELTQAAGAGAVLRFSTVKYSMEFLYGLMEPASRALDGSGPWSIGVDVAANCLGVDLYGDGQDISDDVLASLAHLDPDGDAIRVRLFVGSLSDYDETAVKEPAFDAVSTPVPGGAREFPKEEFPADAESEQPAQYDTQPRRAEDLPQAKRDVIYGTEE